jgi:hypothetical protein
MDTKEEGKEGRNEKTFRSFGKKVDDFVVELNQAGDKMQREFQEKFEELKVAGERLKKEAENSERWKEVEISLKRAGDELTKAFKAAFSKNKPNNN